MASTRRRDKRPARVHYWASGQLEKNKIRNLMKYNGMTREEATMFWRAARRGRMKK